MKIEWFSTVSLIHTAHRDAIDELAESKWPKL
jgi:hypothetical protein